MFVSCVLFALFVLARLGNKDVLFIAVDDMRPVLGVYGHTEVKSPNIDALATKSPQFEKEYFQSGCLLSFPSLFADYWMKT